MAPANADLCDCCQKIFSKKPSVVSSRGRTFYHEQHHESCESLINATKRGCPLCIRILSWVFEYYKSFSEDNSNWFQDYRIAWELVADEHELVFKCRRSGTPNDVGVQNEVASVKLVLSTCLSQPTPYVTLSHHRWGISNIIKLLVSNLESMITGFELSTLPVVFQEAITITRYLGIQYVWIDSLCIIQDSLQDWTLEAGNMCNVYKNAWCNIALTSNAEYGARCFWSRDLSSLRPLEVDIFWDIKQDSPKGSYYLRVPPGLRFSKGVDHEPLHSRGWVFQERLLSRCVLHFTNSQVFFECNAMKCCEMYPTGLTTDVDHETAARTYLRGLQLSSLTTESVKERHRLYNIWGDMVRSYCYKHLTQEQDKLVAIAGLSREIGKHLNDTYYAGLWKSNLPQHLLWYVVPYYEDPQPQPPLSYRAPSLSWACTNGHYVSLYQFDDCCLHTTDLIEILEVQTVGLDSFGTLQSGHITLHGFPKSVSFKEDTMTLPSDPRYSLGIGMRPLVTLSIDGTETDHFYLDHFEQISNKSFSSFALPVLSHPKEYRHLGRWEMGGLLLAKDNSTASTEGVMEYRRIGYFSLNPRDFEGLGFESKMWLQGRGEVITLK